LRAFKTQKVVAAKMHRATTFMLESFLAEILQGFFLESGKVLVGCAWFFGELQRDRGLFHFYF